MSLIKHLLFEQDFDDYHSMTEEELRAEYERVRRLSHAHNMSIEAIDDMATRNKAKQEPNPYESELNAIRSILFKDDIEANQRARELEQNRKREERSARLSASTIRDINRLSQVIDSINDEPESDKEWMSYVTLDNVLRGILDKLIQSNPETNSFSTLTSELTSNQVDTITTAIEMVQSYISGNRWIVSTPPKSPNVIQSLTESVVAPTTISKVSKLAQVLKLPVEADDAIELLDGLIYDPELTRAINKIQIDRPEQDVRPLIIQWIRDQIWDRELKWNKGVREELIKLVSKPLKEQMELEHESRAEYRISISFSHSADTTEMFSELLVMPEFIKTLSESIEKAASNSIRSYARTAVAYKTGNAWTDDYSVTVEHLDN